MTAPTLTEFLLARIAEDEAMAQEAQARASIYRKPVKWHWLRTDGNSSAWEPTNHTPARVLAECATKRRVVERYIGAGGLIENFGSPEYLGALEEMMRDLATIYADHPDYDEAWRA